MNYEETLEQIEEAVYLYQGRVENGADHVQALNWLIEDIQFIKAGNKLILDETD